MNKHLFSIRFQLLASFLFVTLFSGCPEKGPPEAPKGGVSGTVTVDDNPLGEGEITFVTVADGLRETLPILGGKFQGNVGQGNRKVEIRAYKEQKAETDMYGADAPTTKVNYIPEQYNSQTTLSAIVNPTGNSPLEYKISTK